MQKKMILTEDGSSSLFDEVSGEHYHSVFGALSESELVFIRNGLLFSVVDKKKISILEMGFGTGLNALLALRTITEKNVQCCYTATEAYPISIETAEQLNYCEHASLVDFSNLFRQLHLIEWGKFEAISPLFKLRKIQVDMRDFRPERECFDLIFFDAFSPQSQPELWSEAIFSKLFESLTSKGVLVTYCSRGTVKETLRNVGFELKRLPGPKGKRHVLRCIKP